MIQEIDVVIYPFSRAKLESRAVRVVGRDGIGIQREFAEDNQPYNWRIIHMKSGISLCSARDLVEARELRNFWITAQMGGVKVADLPACELCAGAEILAGKLYEFVTCTGVGTGYTSGEFLEDAKWNAKRISNALSCKR